MSAQRADAGEHQSPDRDPGPEGAELLADELRMALAGDDAEPDGQLLHEIEDGDQQKLQKN